MEYQATSLLGSKKIEITFTDKPVTAWGGLTLFVDLARQIGLEHALREALPFKLTSPNATDPVEIVLAFMAGVLTAPAIGTRRAFRWDKGVRKFWGSSASCQTQRWVGSLRRFTEGIVTQAFLKA